MKSVLWTFLAGLGLFAMGTLGAAFSGHGIPDWVAVSSAMALILGLSTAIWSWFFAILPERTRLSVVLAVIVSVVGVVLRVVYPEGILTSLVLFAGLGMALATGLFVVFRRLGHRT